MLNGFGTRYVFVNHLWYPAGPDGRPRPGSVGTKTKPRPPRSGGGFGGGSRGGALAEAGSAAAATVPAPAAAPVRAPAPVPSGGRAGCSAKNLYGVQLDETVKL